MRWPVEKAAHQHPGNGENIDEASDPVLKKSIGSAERKDRGALSGRWDVYVSGRI